MIRPANFGFNAETAVNNAFQSKADRNEESSIRELAKLEFDNMVEALQMANVDVHVWQDDEKVIKPDAVFPNNWFSTTPDGALITYPMFAANRRIERDARILDYVESNFIVERRYEFEHYEDSGLFLEGTGSMIIDHDAHVIYACLSPRTDIQLLDKISVLLNYEVMAFNSVDENSQQIYHTNVMMALAEYHAIICMDSITSMDEQQRLQGRVEAGGKTLFPISHKQVNAFAGNMIQLRNYVGEPVLVMSLQAYNSLTKTQVEILQEHYTLVTPDITTIEKYGGGSARCMIAEIFLEEREGIL